MKKGLKVNHLFLKIIFYSTLTFLFAVAINLSPFLRGPDDWPPEWRYPYLFSSTLSKLWLPIFISSLVILMSKFKRLTLTKLFFISFWGFIFQISVLFSSRAGINVLLHRIINPDLNGYFTAAINSPNIINLLSDYKKIVLSLPMHAKGHPPGGIILFKLLISFLHKTFFVSKFIVSISPLPSTPDVLLLWTTLSVPQQASALISTLLIPFISSLTAIPVYYLAKNLYSKQTALFASIAYLIIPALTSFTPLFDTLFPLLAVYGVLTMVKKQPVLSGVIFSIGIFFSLSIIPVIIMLFLWLLLKEKYSFKTKKKLFLNFFIGFLIFPTLLLVFHYNSLSNAFVIVQGQTHRSYLPWVFYNLYDFFVFISLPISILFLGKVWKRVRPLLTKNLQLPFRRRDLKLSRSFETGSWEKIGFSLPLIITLIVLTLSGLSRAETGRIWLPLMPFSVIEGISFLRTKEIKPFIIIFSLIIAQTLVIIQFWVTLW